MQVTHWNCRPPLPRAWVAWGFSAWMLVCAAAVSSLHAAGPHPFGARDLVDTSRYALGSFTINVLFIEDANNRWVDAGRTVAYHQDQMQLAVDWWMGETASLHEAASLDITLDFINAAAPLQVGDIGGAGFSTAFIDDLFDQLGYAAIPDRDDKPRHFNEDQRDAHATHWSFTQVVKPVDGRPHTNGINGSMSIGFMYDFRNIYMHEWAHMFGAADEYPPHHTGTHTGYLHHVNGNAFYLADGVTPNPDFMVKSLMQNNWPAINDFTRGQIGTQDLDADTIPDILDTFPTLLADMVDSTPQTGRFVFDASAIVNPLPYPGPHGIPAITINTIAGAEVAVDGGPWTPIASLDGDGDRRGALPDANFPRRAGVHRPEPG